MAEIAILYFDDEVSERRANEPSWRTIIESLGFKPDIRFDTSLDSLASELVRRPHIVIVDNVIVSTDAHGRPKEMRNEGARFIEENKAAHPDSFFILYTGKGFAVEQLGVRLPNPDLIVSKDYLIEERYQAYIASQLKARLNRAPIETPVIDDGPQDETFRYETQSLIEQVIFDWMPQAGIEARNVTAQLTKLAGGFSGAWVYRLQLSGGATGSTVPTVLKLGDTKQIEREIEAFQRYAKWLLPHDMRVDIVGKGTIGERAALCYAFALGGQDKVEPAAEALRRGNRKVIDTVIKFLFQTDRQAWYRVTDDTGAKLKSFVSNIPEYPGKKDDWRAQCFEATLQRIADAEGLTHTKNDGRMEIGRHRFGELRPTLRTLPDVKVPKCICHGDLNANNIFVNKNNIALIDFEQTGPHHIFRDFISFESSVRSLYAPTGGRTASFDDLLDLEIALLRDRNVSVNGDAVLLEVQRIRQSAFRLFPQGEPKLYAATLALHLWKLLGFRENSTDMTEWGERGERYIAAGLISALTVLA